MEHSIQDETTTTALHNDNWQPRPELLRAMQGIATIADGDDSAVITDRQIAFTNGAQRTTITASNVDLVTVDGLRISERIDIRTARNVRGAGTDEEKRLAMLLGEELKNALGVQFGNAPFQSPYCWFPSNVGKTQQRCNRICALKQVETVRSDRRSRTL